MQMDLFQPDVSLSDRKIIKKRLKLFLKDFKITKIINLGNQSNIYEAQSVHFQEKIVIKTIQLYQLKCQQDFVLQKVKNQILVNTAIQESQKIYTKYFSYFHGYFIENNKIVLIIQLCKSNALTMFKKLKTYDQKYTFCLILLHDMIEALKCLENLSIVHNDIKSQNIFFKGNLFKLVDFSNANLQGGQKSDIQSLGLTILYLLQVKIKSQQQTYLKNLNDGKYSLNNKNANNEQKHIQIFPIFEILNKIIEFQLKTFNSATQIYTEFLKIQQYFDQQKNQNLIKQIVYCQKSQNKQNQAQLLKYLFLKALQHRQQQLSVYFIIFLSCIKQMIKINQKLTKLNRVMQNIGINRNKKVFLQIKLLKNVKTSCIKMVEVLYKIMFQNQQFQSVNAITSFGQIQLNIQKDHQFIHQDQGRLQNFIKILLNTYAEFQKQNQEHQINSMAKILQQQVCKKSVKFDNVLVCISENSSKNQIQIVNFNQKSFSKIKSQKKVQSLQKRINNKLPKSIKYINDQNSSKQVNQKQVLDNFLKFYSKDNLKVKFPLLGEITFILKRLIQTADNPMKRQIFVQQEFIIWDLSLDFFRI